MTGALLTVTCDILAPEFLTETRLPVYGYLSNGFARELQLFTRHEDCKIDDCTARIASLETNLVSVSAGARKLSEAVPVVGIIMGSRSDWETMREASAILAALDVPHECKVVSAHRTPDRLYDYAKSAVDRGLHCIIAGAGGAAHLPGMVAAMTRLPVLGVPVQSKALDGMDSLLSIVQMPAGIPVGTLAIGKAGAANAALLAAAMLANNDPALAEKLTAWRAKQTDSVGETPE
jgi:5-(carboxyamino)imidazole ribonucleotide mutase